MVKIEKIKYLIIIALIFIAPSVYATSLSFSNATAGISSIKYDSTYGYNYSTYTNHIAHNTSFTTTTSNGYTYLTRARLYSYFTSANALSKSNQYTFKYKICTAWTDFNGYFTSANIKLLYVGNNTSANFDNINTENADAVSITRSAVSGESNCTNLIITYRPTTSSIRAVGFWVSFLNFVPNTNTCWSNDCGNVGYNSFSGELLQTYNGNYGNNGYFKFNLSIEYTTKGDNAIIEQNTQTIINQQNQIKDEIVGLPAKIWNIFKEGLKELFIPTEAQMQDLFDTVENDITTKLGILGLPINVYTTTMRLINNVNSEENWCINWDNIKVPNFENHNIIQAGSWCFDTLEENQTMHTLRATSHGIMGALLLLSFLAYLNNKKNRILEIPDRDEYTYITQEDVYSIDKDTGEVTGQWHKDRKTRREKN